MIQINLIEKETLRCSENHDLPIIAIDIGKDVKMNDRLLCSECMLNIRPDMKIVGLNNIESKIENNIKENIQKKISLISQKKEQLTKLFNSIDQWKQTFNQTIDSIQRFFDYWMDNFISQEQVHNSYNFIQELDNYINQSQSHENDYELFVQSIIKINKTSINKIQLKLTQLNSHYRKYITDTKESLLEIISIQQPKITLKPINNQQKQSDFCWTIAFNQTGQIMVSGCNQYIKVWDFKDGQLKEVKKLEGHNQNIRCLLFSKLQNSFISGSNDNTIRCWKQLNGQEWNSQQSYQEHTNWIECLLLCKKENTLFSGSVDKSIKIWKVDFNNNNLKFSYSLMKHTLDVFGLSLNESETFLVSCGAEQQIIIWKKSKEKKWEFYQIVKQSINESGVTVCFIKENQFIWICGNKNGKDCLSYFELINGDFVEQKEKEQQLIISSDVYNLNLFPIVFNKEKEIILLRHKFHVYLLTKQTQGRYRISTKLKFQNNSIQGTMTNNAKYIILWEKTEQNFQIYQIEYQ
ncbi:unnamed protein product [Paramecium sonneborni]|uniref:WD40-repeat-containing domain n=1 Tax=Paramecium sonneborni TaxID=65129 RepID=A0A8S1PBU9_9CILI|nr:unnamed protein product [Paramecium sonneborni]